MESTHKSVTMVSGGLILQGCHSDREIYTDSVEGVDSIYIQPVSRWDQFLILSETAGVPPDMALISTHVVKCSCETKPVSAETHIRSTHGRAGKEVSEKKTNIWLLK